MGYRVLDQLHAYLAQRIQDVPFETQIVVTQLELDERPVLPRDVAHEPREKNEILSYRYHLHRDKRLPKLAYPCLKIMNRYFHTAHVIMLRKSQHLLIDAHDIVHEVQLGIQLVRRHFDIAAEWFVLRVLYRCRCLFH